MEEKKDYCTMTEEDSFYSVREFPGEEEDDSDQFSLQNGSPFTSSKATVITKESLLLAQREDLRRVMKLLHLTERHARTLLIHHRWDIEKLQAMLVEKGKDQLFAEAGVVVGERKTLPSSLSISTITCNVCMEYFSSNEVTEMDCGHYFCNNCWTEHFTVKINEGESRSIRCMAHECNTICDEAIIKNLVSAKDVDLAERFERYLLESYIDDNEKVKWCPSVPHCGNAIRVQDDECCEVECLCGKRFCFKCLSEVHSPCSCLMLKLWIREEESASVNWITRNTVPCPKCHKAVEKNGGCIIMYCLCGQAYCYLCGEATGRIHTWENIEGHSCQRYREGEKTAKDEKQTHHLYVHYHYFYNAHKSSLEFEEELMDYVQSMMSNLEKKESILSDFSWVSNGLRKYFISKRFLAYSYPFAFYMFRDDLLNGKMTKVKKTLKKYQFQFMQWQLQAIVVKLANVLQKTILELLTDEGRIQVNKLSVSADKQRKKMYEFIENDLLGALRMDSHNIAPYRTNGVERASEYPIWKSKNNLNGRHMRCREERIDQPPSSGSLQSVERRSASRTLKEVLFSKLSTCLALK